MIASRGLHIDDRRPPSFRFEISPRCSAASTPSTASTSTSPRASSSPSSVPRARARPRCSACWRAWRRRRCGDILLRGKRINDCPANKRPTCMVFQSLALFPHRTVGENIEFSLKIKGSIRRQAQGARARTDAISCACREDLLRQERDEMFRRRAPARGARPRPRLRSGNPVLRRAAVGHRLQAAQDAREGAEGHPPRDAARPSSTSPTAWKRRW